VKLFVSFREFGFETEEFVKDGSKVTLVLTGTANVISRQEANVSVETVKVVKVERK
jgi:hypothetical protein